MGRLTGFDGVRFRLSMFDFTFQLQTSNEFRHRLRACRRNPFEVAFEFKSRGTRPGCTH